MRHRIGRMLAAVLGLCCLLWIALPTGNLSAQDDVPVVVRVAPDSSQVAPGGQVEIAVEVVDVQDLYGFDIVLTFDPTVMQVVDADPGGNGVQVSLGTFLEPGFMVRNAADNATGRLQMAMTQINPSEAKSGTGLLIVVKMEAGQAEVTMPIGMEKVQLARRDGTQIFSNPAPGQVTVGSAAEALPTNTPLPTQPAGTMLPTGGATAVDTLPTSTPESTPAPPAATSPPTGTAIPPADTPQPGSTPQATATIPPAATDPGAPAPASTVTAAAPAGETALPPTPTPTTTQTAEAGPTGAEPTLVAEAPSSDAQPDPDGPAADNSSRILLALGIVGLGLTVVVGIVIAGVFLVWRTSGSNQG